MEYCKISSPSHTYSSIPSIHYSITPSFRYFAISASYDFFTIEILLEIQIKIANIKNPPGAIIINAH